MVIKSESNPTRVVFFLSHQRLGMVKIGMISNAKVRNSGLEKAGYGNKIRGGKKEMSGKGASILRISIQSNEAVP